METQGSWARFEGSGRVEDYLQYCFFMRDRQKTENGRNGEVVVNKAGVSDGGRTGGSDGNGVDGGAGEGV